jgi:hypothetical protein
MPIQTKNASAIGFEPPLAFVSPMVGRRAGDGFFDPVELADASRAYLAIGEPAAGCTSKDMRPTGVSVIRSPAKSALNPE